jgi:tetratricopeptide (TPR) repeat protein
VLDLKREDKGYAGYDLLLIARAEDRLGRLLDSIKTLEKALPMLSTAIDRDHEADARLYLSRILLNLGRAEEARPHVARAMVLAEELKENLRICDSWAASGQIEGALGNLSTLALMGRPDLALARFEEAARRHEHLEDGGSLAEDLSAIAGLQLDFNRPDEALAAAQKAVEKAQEVDDRPREVEARVRLSQVQGRKGDWSAAAETLDEAVILIRQVYRDEPFEQIRLILTAAATDHRAKLDHKALERLELAKKIAEDSNQPALKAIVAEARQEFDNRDKPPVPPKPPGE